MGKPKKSSGKKAPKDLNVKDATAVKGGIVITKTTDSSSTPLFQK
ncbi:MAG TPA: hypothetical protein VFJ24_03095 [Gaiellales bacterium]|nr:hypothetical protein [Gaiellales bacterium]